MLLKDQGITKISKSALEISPPLSRKTLTSLNIEKLKGVLSYFSYLHANGEISDKTFENLVQYACSIFIENEVETRIEEALERKLMNFLSTRLVSRIGSYISDMEEVFYGLDVSRGRSKEDV